MFDTPMDCEIIFWTQLILYLSYHTVAIYFECEHTILIKLQLHTTLLLTTITMCKDLQNLLFY